MHAFQPFVYKRGMPASRSYGQLPVKPQQECQLFPSIEQRKANTLATVTLVIAIPSQLCTHKQLVHSRNASNAIPIRGKCLLYVREHFDGHGQDNHIAQDTHQE